MTAAEWEASHDPDQMLNAAGKKIPERALWLFACGAARRVLDQLPEFAKALLPRVEVAAELPPAERAAALRAVVAGIDGTAGVLVRTGLRIDQPLAAALQIAMMLRWLEHRGAVSPRTLFGRAMSLVETLPLIHRPSPEQAAILRCVAGNPFGHTVFDPAWRTSDVMALARTAAAERTFDNYPILADALQDAGCDDELLLNHLRNDTLHARGCRALDRVLDRE
jgi:hypothetical protein